MALARESGISHQTLSRWLREVPTLPSMSEATDETNPKKIWTAQEKLRLVLDASRLPEAGLGGFLRQEGLHSAQLEEWRRTVLQSLSEPKPSGKRTAAERRQAKQEAERIRALQRDLDRKNKALAEVTALLTLQKKVQAIWGGEDENTPRKNDS